jgi:hypothetical protein
LALVVGFLAVFLVRPGRPLHRPTLSATERVYVIVALSPVLLTLAAPGIIVSTVGAGWAARAWSGRVSNFGIGLSLGLTMVGLYFLWRKRRHAAAPSPWLYAAVIVAAVPAALTALLVATWNLTSILAAWKH